MHDTQFSRPIVHIDDEDVDLLLFHHCLSKAVTNPPIRRFVSAESAFQYLAFPAGELPPRIVLTDFKMPRVSGLDVVRWVRSQPELSDVPVVVLSSSGLESDLDQARLAGADGFAVKFPAPEALREIVEHTGRGAWKFWPASRTNMFA